MDVQSLEKLTSCHVYFCSNHEKGCFYVILKSESHYQTCILKLAEKFPLGWTKGKRATAFFWFILVTLVDVIALPYRLASRKLRQKRLNDRAGSSGIGKPAVIGPIYNRVERLEVEFGKLASTHSSLREPPSDPDAERIKILEAELAETKKVRNDQGHL